MIEIWQADARGAMRTARSRAHSQHPLQGLRPGRGPSGEALSIRHRQAGRGPGPDGEPQARTSSWPSFAAACSPPLVYPDLLRRRGCGRPGPILALVPADRRPDLAARSASSAACDLTVYRFDISFQTGARRSSSTPV
ncbi:MAG: hypothetical protein M5U07_19375 [Xanthobacteraceae bacterium]|nr:hypothetical protein [Xanthobacteraceae bacterium]